MTFKKKPAKRDGRVIDGTDAPEKVSSISSVAAADLNTKVIFSNVIYAKKMVHYENGPFQFDVSHGASDFYCLTWCNSNRVNGENAIRYAHITSQTTRIWQDIIFLQELGTK